MIELFKSKCCNSEAIINFGMTDFIGDVGKKSSSITFPQVHTASFICSKCGKQCNIYSINKKLKTNSYKIKNSYNIKIIFKKMKKSGLYVKNKNNNFTIYINNSYDIIETIKTLYHEFTHFVEWIIANNKEVSIVESNSKKNSAEKLSCSIENIIANEFKKRIVKV